MITFIFFLNLWSLEPVIKSNQASNINFEKYLIDHPQKESFVDFYLHKRKNSHKEITALLKSAQFEFLNGSLENAKTYFKDITNFEHQADWDLNERSIIHFSFLRLAQLEENKDRKSIILKQALIFDDNIKIDHSLFPPPLIAEYSTLKKEMSLNIWQLPKNNDDFNVLLINGRKQDSSNSFVKSSAHKKRFTFLSNTYEPVHLIIDVADLQNTILPKIEIVTGTCDNPTLKFNKFDIKSFIYLDDSCSKEVDSSKPPLDLALLNNNSIQQRKTTPIFKKKWFWIGASVLASGILYSSLKNGNRSHDKATDQTPTVKTFTNE